MTATRRSTLAAGELDREARRWLPKLTAQGARLILLGEETAGLFTARTKGRRPAHKIERRVVEAFLDREWIGRAAQTDGEDVAAFVLSDIGRQWLRRRHAKSDGYRHQHQLTGSRFIVDDQGIGRIHRVNLAETPLAWLRKRKDTEGRPLISQAEFDAGERLREDYERAGLTQRVTADWSIALPADGQPRGPSAGPDITDMAMTARRRLHQALNAVGGELARVLVAVCCEMQGLESAERKFGWPRRSGKIVLKIALGQLARHYGMIRDQ